MLNLIKEADEPFYDSDVVNVIDFMWNKHKYKVISFNIIYIIYPILLSILIALPDENVFEHWIIGLTTGIILLMIELF